MSQNCGECRDLKIYVGPHKYGKSAEYPAWIKLHQKEQIPSKSYLLCMDFLASFLKQILGTFIGYPSLKGKGS